MFCENPQTKFEEIIKVIERKLDLGKFSFSNFLLIT